jgi:hypothetical protein
LAHASARIGAGFAVIASALAGVGAGSSRIEWAFRMIRNGLEDTCEDMRGLHGSDGIWLGVGSEIGDAIRGDYEGFIKRKGLSARKALRGNSVLLLLDFSLVFLGFIWSFLARTRALIVSAGLWEPRQVSDPGDEAVDPQRQIAQALAGRVIDRVGERR